MGNAFTCHRLVREKKGGLLGRNILIWAIDAALVIFICGPCFPEAIKLTRRLLNGPKKEYSENTATLKIRFSKISEWR